MIGGPVVVTVGVEVADALACLCLLACWEELAGTEEEGSASAVGACFPVEASLVVLGPLESVWSLSFDEDDEDEAGVALPPLATAGAGVLRPLSSVVLALLLLLVLVLESPLYAPGGAKVWPTVVEEDELPPCSFARIRRRC